MADVVQHVEVDPAPHVLLRPLFLRGGHHLLSSGDVLVAGESTDLPAGYLLLVDVNCLRKRQGDQNHPNEIEHIQTRVQVQVGA